jgi:hypothetical protein
MMLAQVYVRDQALSMTIGLLQNLLRTPFEASSQKKE